MRQTLGMSLALLAAKVQDCQVIPVFEIFHLMTSRHIFIQNRYMIMTYLYSEGCCPMVQISSDGPAKDEQSSSLSVYQYFRLNDEGKRIYRNSDDIYLYFNTIQSVSRWRV